MTFEQIKILVFALADLVAILWALMIKPKIDAELTSNEQAELMEWITIGINAAEMVLGTDKGKEKKDYVMDFAKEKLSELTRLDITDEALGILIEGFVKEVKYPTAN